MNAHPKFLSLAALGLVAVGGAVAAVACSSTDNTAPSMNVLDSGQSDDSTASSGSSGSSSGSSSGGSSSGGSSGSSSGDSGGTDAKTEAGPTCAPDGGAGATCNSCATVGNDTYNTCSPYNCAGFYNNTSHGVPSPLPTL